MRALAVAAVPALLLVTTACGGSATASLKMRNDTAIARLGALQDAATSGGAGDAAYVTPAVLGIKLVAVYIAEDVDPVTQNNRGNTAMIWLNGECADDIEHCGPASTMQRVITTFFDFAQGTAAVNAALNGQGRKVEPGTYRYARVEFCKYGPGDQPNVRWQAGTMAAARGFTWGTCAVTSQPFASPLQLADGDSVEVTLAYDLAKVAMEGTPPAGNGPGQLVDGTGAARWFSDCVDHDGLRTCIDWPEFTPSAQKR